MINPHIFRNPAGRHVEWQIWSNLLSCCSMEVSLMYGRDVTLRPPVQCCGPNVYPLMWHFICLSVSLQDKRAKEQNRGDLDWLLAQVRSTPYTDCTSSVCLSVCLSVRSIPTICSRLESPWSFKFHGDMVVDTSNWESRFEIKRSKVTVTGNENGFCEYLCESCMDLHQCSTKTILSALYRYHRWHFNNGNRSFLWYLSVCLSVCLSVTYLCLVRIEMP